MHIKNIRNIKFNGQTLKIYTQKKIYEKFEELEEKLCSSLGGYRSNKVYYIGNIYIVRTKFGAQAQVYGILVQ